jgi:FG-GAP-like repeat/Abnormal spindle-like microcephaly-assoc'd, ASPM-SPD-2-Hydin
MKANRRGNYSGLLAKLFWRDSQKCQSGSRKAHLRSSMGTSRRMQRAVCTVLLLALAASITLASRAAQDSPAAPAATPNSTSINGSGNIFLTANLIANPGTANGAALSVAVADFDGDAKEDIAVTSAGCNTCGVSIVRGNGDGTFQAPLFTANLGGPYYVAAGDFNGDGKQDLAVIGFVPTNLNVAAVFVLLGNGDGTFTLKTTITGISSPQAVMLGDFNGDGKLDMAVTDRTTNSVSVFLGIGDGTMQAPINTSGLGIGAATYLAAADFNKDNKLDLVLADANNNGGGHIVVLLGNGDGHFQAARSFATTGGGWDVAVGDFNGDGIPDIAATTALAQTVDIFLGKGDGNFQPAVSFSAGLLGGNTQNLAVGDFNKDGKLDLITSINGGFNAGSSVSVLLGNGDGTFSSPLLLAANQAPGQLAVVDFNGDGNPDWIAGSTTGQQMTLALGNGNGTFQAGVNYALGAGPFVALADFNKDGKLDVVAVDRSSNDVRVLLGRGDGTFQPGIITPVSGAFSGIAAGDFNNDGNQDVVVSDSTGGAPRNVIVLLGKGDGTFAAPARFTTGGSGEGLILAEDFNGDGKLDIAVVNQSDNTVSILLGNGDGTFQAPKITPGLATDGFLGAMAAGDLNGDGKLDLVVPDYVGSASAQVAILLGKGDGTFQAPTFLTSNGGSTWPVVADFNQDGKLDLAVANQFGTIDIFLGNGNGTFNAPLVLSDVQLVGGCCMLSPIPIALAAADFNLDGNLDLLVGVASADVNNTSLGLANSNLGLQVFLGKGDGTFTGPQDYLAGAQSFPVLVGDFNGDGAPDVAAGDLGENFVSILLNQTPPPISVSPKSLTFADQLVGTSSATQSITVKNNGTRATTITIATSGDFTQTNTCPVSPATLAVDANCTINSAFQPTTTGPLSGSITITHKLAGSPQTVNTTGTGVAPAVTLTTTSINFGNQAVGSSSAVQVIGLTNSGTATLNISSISITGANSGDFFQTNNCGGSVAAGASCNINETFKPTTSGIRKASVSISDNAAGSPQTVSLTGVGTIPAVMLSPTNLNFAPQLVTTASAPQNATLTNNGNSTLHITGIAITGANSGDFSETNTCGASVSAAANCTITVTFKPTATGNRPASVTITDDAAGSPQTIALTGIGTDFSISAASGGSTSATLTAGQMATYNLEVSPVSGFQGTVALNCSGAPSLALCTASPASMTLNGTVASALTATVTTTASSVTVPTTEPHTWPPLALVRLISLLLLAAALLAFLAHLRGAANLPRRGLAFAPALALALMILTWVGGCAGGGGGGGQHNPGTPTGTYTLTLTGTSSGVSHTLNLSLTVN